MRKLAALISLITCSFVSAQRINYDNNSEEIKNLVSGTLYIVPTGDRAFDDSLIANVKKYWKICPSEALRQADADSYLSDGSKYFIAPTIGGGDVKEPLKIVSSLKQNGDITVFMGGKHKGLVMKTGNLEICSQSLVLFLKENALNGLAYPVKCLNDVVDLIITNQINKISGATGNKTKSIFFEKNICNRAKVLKTKTLIINKNSTAFFIKEGILKPYKYKYEIVDEIKLAEMMNGSDRKNYCFAAWTGNKNLLIYDMETAELVYISNPDDAPMKIAASEKDIIKLNAVITGKCEW